MEIDKKLHEEIKEYCKLNGLKTSEYVNSLLKKAFMEDKYGVSPFKRAEDSVIGNKAFEDAVNAEVKRILNDKEELHALLSAKFENGENGRVYSEEALRDAVAKFNQKFFKGTDELETAIKKFNETFFHGMKESQEIEKEISDYMEKNNLEPVSMDELIYGDDESGQSTVKNVQILPDFLNDAIASGKALETVEIQQNVEKKEDICDKTEAKESTNKVKKRQITVK